MCIRNRIVSLAAKVIILAAALVTLLIHFFVPTANFSLDAFGSYPVILALAVVLYYLVAAICCIMDIGRKGVQGSTTPGPHLKGCLVYGAILLLLAPVLPRVFLPFLVQDSLLATAPRIIFVGIAAAVVLDWLLFDRKGRFQPSDPFLWLVLPYMYFAFILVRMGIQDSLDPVKIFFSPNAQGVLPLFITSDNIGWPAIIKYFLILTVILIAMGYLLFVLDYVLGRPGKRKARAEAAARREAAQQSEDSRGIEALQKQGYTPERASSKEPQNPHAFFASPSSGRLGGETEELSPLYRAEKLVHSEGEPDESSPLFADTDPDAYDTQELFQVSNTLMARAAAETARQQGSQPVEVSREWAPLEPQRTDRYEYVPSAVADEPGAANVYIPPAPQHSNDIPAAVYMPPSQDEPTFVQATAPTAPVSAARSIDSPNAVPLSPRTTGSLPERSQSIVTPVPVPRHTPAANEASYPQTRPYRELPTEPQAPAEQGAAHSNNPWLDGLPPKK